MMRFSSILQGGDRRSTGRTDEVAEEVARNPRRFAELWDCLADSDPMVRVRAADALEKVSRRKPALLEPHRDALLSLERDDGTAEVRWHLIAIIGRLTLSGREAAETIRFLERCLRRDESRIVKVMALQAIADICESHPELSAEKSRLLDQARSSPWPSLRTRARKLAAR